MLSDGVQEKFRLFIKPHFDQFLSEIKYFGDFDYNRITVWADIDMYNWKEDAFVWGQKREKASKTFQVFFDSKLVCYLNEHEDKDKTLRNFWKGFLEAYEILLIYI